MYQADVNCHLAPLTYDLRSMFAQLRSIAADVLYLSRIVHQNVDIVIIRHVLYMVLVGESGLKVTHQNYLHVFHQ